MNILSFHRAASDVAVSSLTLNVGDVQAGDVLAVFSSYDGFGASVSLAANGCNFTGGATQVDAGNQTTSRVFYCLATPTAVGLIVTTTFSSAQDYVRLVAYKIRPEINQDAELSGSIIEQTFLASSIDLGSISAPANSVSVMFARTYTYRSATPSTNWTLSDIGAEVDHAQYRVDTTETLANPEFIFDGVAGGAASALTFISVVGNRLFPTFVPSLDAPITPATLVSLDNDLAYTITVRDGSNNQVSGVSITASSVIPAIASTNAQGESTIAPFPSGSTSNVTLSFTKAGYQTRTVSIDVFDVPIGGSGGGVVGYNPPASTVVGVTILPTAVSIVAGQEQQFTATVQGTNSPSQAVTWSAPDGGTADSTGTYTAPFIAGNAYKMRATSVQNPNIFGESTITVSAPVVVPPVPILDDKIPTAGDQIIRALRLIGVLAEGETMSAPVAQDCLVALNQMLDSWSIENLTVFTSEQKVFTWPAGQISRTMGPTGNFVTTRPIQVDDSTYFKDTASGLSYGVVLLTDLQYNSIPLKTVTSTYPQLLHVEYGMPNVTLTAHPVPTKTLDWVIVTMSPLNQPSTLNTKLVFPPGYMRAFAYNLAMEIAPEFGVEPSVQVQKIAATSKRNLKRMNSTKDLMSMPSTLIAQSSRFNIYSGK